MAEPIANAAVARFTTEALPERDRLACWREFYGRKLLRLDWEPRSELPFRASMATCQMPGVRSYRTRFSPAHARRTRALINGEDEVTFFAPMRRYRIAHLGRELELDPGDAALLSNTDETAVTSLESGHHLGVVLSRKALRPVVRDIDSLLMHRIPRGTEGLELLAGYLRSLHQEKLPLSKPELRFLVATHIRDLVTFALGATRDAAEIGSGLSAARLHAMQEDIRRNLSRPNLSVHSVAARHRVSVRYVQKLFEESGRTFTQFVMEERLMAAHKALIARVDAPIGAVAYDIGFNDISNFNRAFRLRFGCTPGDARRAARILDDDWNPSGRP
jgi:AraC-like DNA-binding protein